MADRSQQIELKLLIEAIYLRYGYDFRGYSAASLKRRVLLALRQLQCEGISELQHKILYDPQVFMELLQYLTIPVSEMFRDPSYYLALREQVVPVLRTYPSLKIWVAGCSTGEEVYSLAILLREEGLLERSISDYYTAAYDSAIMDKSLKDHVTFADHSLATDSVFAETQLVSCRNVLIYFNKPLQDRAFGLFHESLCHRGFLGLGSRETVEFSGYANQYEAFDKQERIFRKL